MASGILFDLDETLIDRRSTLLDYAAKLYFEFQAQATVAEGDFVRIVDEADGRGRAPRDEFFRCIAERSLRGVSPSRVEEHFYEFAWLRPRPFPGVFDTLVELRARRFPLGIVTNGRVRSQRAKIENSGLSEHIDAFVISEAFGRRKPEASIFLHISQELGVEPSSSWYVGDDPVADVKGAYDAGFKTIWLERHLPWPEGETHFFDARVSHVYEVPKIVAAAP